jgi:hypothetical protein
MLSRMGQVFKTCPVRYFNKNYMSNTQNHMDSYKAICKNYLEMDTKHALLITGKWGAGEDAFL